MSEDEEFRKAVEYKVLRLLRPPRSHYDESKLLEVAELDDGTKCPRESIVVLNPNGKKMPGSLFRPKTPAPNSPVCIYTHGNAMDHTAVIELFDLWKFLAHGIAVCGFDFGGCGHGEEELLGMGCREKDEIGCVIDHIKATYGFQQVIVWGLSLGACASILIASERDDISVAVIDSASASEAGEKFSSNPDMHEAVRKRIEELTGYNVDLPEYSTLEAVSKIRIPICFIAGTNDRLVPMSNSEALFDACPSPKKALFKFKGPHVGYRGHSYDEAFQFVCEALNIPTPQ